MELNAVEEEKDVGVIRFKEALSKGDSVRKRQIQQWEYCAKFIIIFYSHLCQIIQAIWKKQETCTAHLVEERVCDSEYNGGQGRAVAGGHLLEVRIMNGVEWTVICHIPYKTKYSTSAGARFGSLTLVVLLAGMLMLMTTVVPLNFLLEFMKEDMQLFLLADTLAFLMNKLKYHQSG